MDRSVRFRPATARVIHEMFDDEVVIVDLDTGRYFCVQEAGADIWRLMLTGQSVAEMAASLAARYDASEDALADATARLCDELVRERLVAATTDTPAARDAAPLNAADPRRPFTPPALQVYTDMQDRLLLDPIHEVDATGWPVAKADDPA
jgi:hypothetical protein